MPITNYDTSVIAKGGTMTILIALLLCFSSINGSEHPHNEVVVEMNKIKEQASPLETSSESPLPQPIHHTSTRVKVALIAGAFGIGTALITSVATLIMHFARCP